MKSSFEKDVSDIVWRFCMKRNLLNFVIFVETLALYVPNLVLVIDLCGFTLLEIQVMV